MNIKKLLLLPLFVLTTTAQPIILSNQTGEDITITIQSCTNKMLSEETGLCTCGGTCNCYIDPNPEIEYIKPEGSTILTLENGLQLTNYPLRDSEATLRILTIPIGNGNGIRLAEECSLYINLGEKSFHIGKEDIPTNTIDDIYYIYQKTTHAPIFFYETWAKQVVDIEDFAGNLFSTTNEYQLSLVLRSDNFSFETNSKPICRPRSKNFYNRTWYQTLNTKSILGFVSRIPYSSREAEKALLTIDIPEEPLDIIADNLDISEGARYFIYHIIQYLEHYPTKERRYKQDHGFHIFSTEPFIKNIHAAHINQIFFLNQFGFAMHPETISTENPYHGIYIVLEWNGAWFTLREDKICNCEKKAFGFKGKTGQFQIGLALGKRGRDFFPTPKIVHRCFLPDKRRDNACFHNHFLFYDYNKNLFDKPEKPQTLETWEWQPVTGDIEPIMSSIYPEKPLFRDIFANYIPGEEPCDTDFDGPLELGENIRPGFIYSEPEYDLSGEKFEIDSGYLTD